MWLEAWVDSAYYCVFNFSVFDDFVYCLFVYMKIEQCKADGSNMETEILQKAKQKDRKDWVMLEWTWSDKWQFRRKKSQQQK